MRHAARLNWAEIYHERPQPFGQLAGRPPPLAGCTDDDHTGGQEKSWFFSAVLARSLARRCCSAPILPRTPSITMAANPSGVCRQSELHCQSSASAAAAAAAAAAGENRDGARLRNEAAAVAVRCASRRLVLTAAARAGRTACAFRSHGCCRRRLSQSVRSAAPAGTGGFASERANEREFERSSS